MPPHSLVVGAVAPPAVGDSDAPWVRSEIGRSTCEVFPCRVCLAETIDLRCYPSNIRESHAGRNHHRDYKTLSMVVEILFDLGLSDLWMDMPAKPKNSAATKAMKMVSIL